MLCLKTALPEKQGLSAPGTLSLFVLESFPAFSFSVHSLTRARVRPQFELEKPVIPVKKRP
jgi:hypothetical protein